LKLSRKCDYALRALSLLAVREGDGYVSIADVAEAEDIPPRYLEQIFLALRNVGLLSSRAGPSGGYRLRKEPGEITLGEVVRLIDGPVAPARCVSETAYEKCPREDVCVLRPVLKEVRDSIAEILDSITIKDICRRAGSSPA